MPLNLSSKNDEETWHSTCIVKIHTVYLPCNDMCHFVIDLLRQMGYCRAMRGQVLLHHRTRKVCAEVLHHFPNTDYRLVVFTEDCCREHEKGRRFLVAPDDWFDNGSVNAKIVSDSK